jgi:SOS-response transcriptional repressor LexA
MGRIKPHAAGHAGEDSCMQGSPKKICVRFVQRGILDGHILALLQPEFYNRSSILSREKEASDSGVPKAQRENVPTVPDWAVQIARFKDHMRLTQSAFAAKLGVSQAIVSAWLLGKKEPRSEMYFKMIRLSPNADAAAFLMKRAADISGSYHVEGISKIMLGAQKKPVRSARGAKFGHLSTDVAEIPLLRDPAAAGTPRQIDPNEIEQVIPFSQSLCPNPEETVCIKIQGDSMSPMLLDGYIVAVDTAQCDPARLRNQMVAARDPEGGVTIKWLRKAGKDTMMLMAQHTSPRYEPVILTPEAVESGWGIIGKVLWWIGQPVP